MTRGDDPVSRDIFQHQACGIADEMSVALRRASFSSIIWDMHDYACGLFTPDAEMIAQADTIPAQLGVMSIAINRMFEEIPRDEWRPGDIIICNDPYRGCAHTMDVCLFSPVFHGDVLIAITSSIAHHADIGGRLPGSTVADNTEVFAEGIILPPLKLFAEGRPDPAIFSILSSNVRLPDASKGDLRAQVAACRIGERRILELAELHGRETFTSLSRACLDYAEAYTRRAIADTPDGESEASTTIEDDVTSNAPVSLRVRATIDGDNLEIDLSDSDDQRDFALNCPWASTVSMACYAAKCLFSPDIAQNEGCVRPLRVTTRKGSVLDPVHPGAVGSRHHTQQAVADLVLMALTKLAPARSAAGAHVSDPLITVSGIDDRPQVRATRDNARYFVLADGLGGGMGASSEADGLDAVDTHSGNCALISAEVVETVSPLRVLRTELVPDSGGPGKHRGGLGMLRDYQLLAKSAVFTAVTQRGSAMTAPWGYEGGGAGGIAGLVVNPGHGSERRLPTKVVSHLMRKGEVIRIVGGGGGGWGNAAERDPELVARDRRQGYVT
ncbi:MAG: hydantoinase B/oxoprolinase family protein [bacterium]|nr:hydantoinase B/oxoprolinase family protein [bacterium]